MYEISLFNVLVLKIAIAAPRPSDVLIRSRRLFMKTEYGIDVTRPLALGERSP